MSVARLNNAAVHGFERDAGSHTTIRLMYPEGAPHAPNEYKKTAVVALVVFKSLDLDWLTSVITKQPLVRITAQCLISHECLNTSCTSTIF